MRRFLLVTLALIPGSVVILRGRTAAGFVLMTIGFFGWDFAFLHYSGLWLGAPSWSGPAGLSGAGVATLISVIWTWVVTSSARARRRKQRVETVIRDAGVAYVCNDMAAAAAAVDRGLKVAADDVDLVHLAWQIALADNDERRARQLERRLRRVDVDEKWAWELNGIQGLPSTPIAQRSSGDQSPAGRRPGEPGIPNRPSLNPPLSSTPPTSPPPSNTEMNA